MSAKNVVSLIAVFLVAGGLVGFFLVQKGKIHIPSPQEGKSTPELSFKDYSGKEVKLSDFRGKALVINSWAAWCPFCREELLAFAAIQKEFGDKVVIVAINRAESLAVAKGYTDRQGTTNNLIFLLDPSDSFYKSIGGFSMPETIFADANGKTQFHKRGPMDADEIRNRIKTLLGE